MHQATERQAQEELHQPLINRVLEWFGQIGHDRLWCTCGYLIWSCKAHKDCEGPRWMIETDHSLCKKKK